MTLEYVDAAGVVTPLKNEPAVRAIEDLIARIKARSDVRTTSFTSDAAGQVTTMRTEEAKFSALELAERGGVMFSQAFDASPDYPERGLLRVLWMDFARQLVPHVSPAGQAELRSLIAKERSALASEGWKTIR